MPSAMSILRGQDPVLAIREAHAVSYRKLVPGVACRKRIRQAQVHRQGAVGLQAGLARLVAGRLVATAQQEYLGGAHCVPRCAPSAVRVEAGLGKVELRGTACGWRSTTGRRRLPRRPPVPPASRAAAPTSGAAGCSRSEMATPAAATAARRMCTRNSARWGRGKPANSVNLSSEAHEAAVWNSDVKLPGSHERLLLADCGPRMTSTSAP